MTKEDEEYLAGAGERYQRFLKEYGPFGPPELVFEVDPAFCPCVCDGCGRGTPYIGPPIGGSNWAPQRGRDRVIHCGHGGSKLNFKVAGEVGNEACPYGERAGLWRLKAREGA